MEHIKQPEKTTPKPPESGSKLNSINISNLKEKFDIKVYEFKKNVDEYIWEEESEKKGKKTTTKHIDNGKFCNEFKKIFSVIVIRPNNVHAQPESYIYKNGMYERGTFSYFHSICYDMFGDLMYPTLYKSLEERLQSKCYVNNNYFNNRNPRYISLNNCVYDIETGNVFKHTKERKLTYKIPTDYNPNINYKFFTDFVYELVGIETEPTIQELFGYCLYTDYNIQKAFMFNGGGANGKDTLMYCLSKLLGERNLSGENLKALVEDKYSPIELQHKLANISGETPNNFKITNSDMFKSLRGGSLISGQRKFGQRELFRNYAKMIFLTNKVPETNDYSYGFFRSWILLDFPNEFSGSSDKKNIKYDMTDTSEKMSGILNYSLVGLKRLLKNQQFTYDLTTDELGDLWKKISEPTLSFVKDCVTDGTSDNKIFNGDLLAKYYRYCEKYNVKSESDRKFWIGWRKYVNEFFDVETFQDKQTGKKGWRGVKIDVG